MPVTFTIDVEDHLAATPSATPRFEVMTWRLLAFLGERAIRATFFIEDGAARRAPQLVRHIAALGHEVASHGYRHVPLRHETRTAFGPAIAAARRRLEELAGAAVIGFRAPGFSLVPATKWVPDSLAEAGFAYSSSVIPGRALSQGFPGAPRGPFLWPSGVLEIPCPVGRIGPLSLPFQGGMYLRYLPSWRYRHLAAQLEEQVNWTYCHPYDVDTDAEFARMAACGWLASLFLWANRRVLLQRWERLAERPDLPFRDRLAALRDRAAPFPVVAHPRSPRQDAAK